MNLLDWSESYQQTTLWITQERWRRHQSWFWKIPNVQWGLGTCRSGVHIVPLHRWVVCSCEIHWRRKRLSSMASLPKSKSSSECDHPLESVSGIHIHDSNSANQFSKMEQKCWDQRERYFFVVRCRDDRSINDPGSVCPRVQWIMERRRQQRKCESGEWVGWISGT